MPNHLRTGTADARSGSGSAGAPERSRAAPVQSTPKSAQVAPRTPRSDMYSDQPSALAAVRPKARQLLHFPPVTAPRKVSRLLEPNSWTDARAKLMPCLAGPRNRRSWRSTGLPHDVHVPVIYEWVAAA